MRNDATAARTPVASAPNTLVTNSGCRSRSRARHAPSRCGVPLGARLTVPSAGQDRRCRDEPECRRVSFPADGDRASRRCAHGVMIATVSRRTTLTGGSWPGSNWNALAATNSESDVSARSATWHSRGYCHVVSFAIDNTPHYRPESWGADLDRSTTRRPDGFGRQDKSDGVAPCRRGS